MTVPDNVTSIGERAFYGNATQMKEVIIPESVVSIGKEAFSGCNKLEKIIIPNSVISIGELAFWGCDKLKEITIPEKVTSIEDGTFYNCSSLEKITIPEGVISIGSDAFQSCNALTEISIPESVTSIGDSAFSYCLELTKLNLPKNITRIGMYTFHYCESLTEINIPKNVVEIGSGAFSQCKALKELVIPKSVERIQGYHTFSNCDNLEKLYILNRNVTLTQAPDVGEDNSVIYSGSNNVVLYAPVNCGIKPPSLDRYCPISNDPAQPDFDIENGKLLAYTGEGGDVTVPDIVTTIGKGAFSYYNNATSITIPEGVTSIEDCAFEGCSSLTKLTIPRSVKIIGENRTFAGCGNLKELTVLSRDTKLEDGDYSNLYSASNKFILYAPIGSALNTEYLEVGRFKPISNDPAQPDFDIENGKLLAYTGEGGDVIVPDIVTTIGKGAFSYYNNAISITIPEGVTSIEDKAFQDSAKLQKIKIPDSVKEIGENAFLWCRDFIIFCGSDSYAKEYAKENGYQYRTGENKIIPESDIKLQNNILTYGNSLSNLKFTPAKFVLEDDKEQEITGELMFENPAFIPEVGITSVAWVFIPEDDTYNKVTGTIDIIVEQKLISIQNNPENVYSKDYIYTEKALIEPSQDQFKLEGILEQDSEDKLEFTFTWYQDSVTEKNRLDSAPMAVGNYILRVKVEAGTNYKPATKDIPIKIHSYICDNATLDSVNKGENNWYHGEVIVNAPKGHLISTDKKNWYSALTITQKGIVSYYLKEEQKEYISEQKQIIIQLDMDMPTGSIQIGEEKWENTFQDAITVGMYTKKEESFTIKAEDSTSGMENGKIEYYITDQVYTGDDGKKALSQLPDTYWTRYTSNGIVIKRNAINIIYVRIIDQAGNITYLSTNKIIHDDIEPEIFTSFEGIEYHDSIGSSCAYDESVTVTIDIKEEVSGLKNVRYELDGNVIALDNNEIKITTPGIHTLAVFAEDNVGNQKKITESFRIYTKPDLEVENGSSVYDGNPLESGVDIVLSSLISKGTISYSYTQSGEQKINGLPTNVGEYWINIDVKEDTQNCYKPQTTQIQYIIKPKEVLANDQILYVAKNEYQYSFDVSTMLPKIDDIKYTIVSVSGSGIFSDTPVLKDSILTIPVKAVSSGGIEEKAEIEISFSKANYTINNAVLTIIPVDKTLVNLTNITMPKTEVYNGKEFAYIGTPTWVTVDGQKVEIEDFTILYESIDGAGYSSSKAPVNAGEYRLTMFVDPLNPSYIGTQSETFAIKKKPITITAKDKYISVGDAIPSLKNLKEGTDYFIEGLVFNEKLEGSPKFVYVDLESGKEILVDNSKAGIYGIAVSGFIGSNYDITYLAGKLVIESKKPEDNGNTGSNTTGSGNNSNNSGGSWNYGSGVGNISNPTTVTPVSPENNTETSTKNPSITEPDQSNNIVEIRPDGTKVETITEAQSDGTIKEIVTETKTDGSTIETKEVKTANNSATLITVVETSTSGQIIANSVIKTGVSSDSNMVSILENLLQEIAQDDRINSVVIEITDTTVKSAINESKQTMITVEIPAIDEITIEKVVLTKESIDIAKETRKELKVNILNGTKDGTSDYYSIVIPAKQLAKIDSSVEEINITIHAERITKLVNNSIKNIVTKVLNENKGKKNKTCIVSLASNEAISAGMKVRIPITEKTTITKGSKVYVYKYNAKTGKLIETANCKKKVLKDGSIEIAVVPSVTDYVISAKKLSGSKVQTIKDSISVSIPKKTVKVGKKFNMKISLPDTVSTKSKFGTEKAMIIYKSSNRKLASVSKFGVITAKKRGTVSIKATIKLASGQKITKEQKVIIK